VRHPATASGPWLGVPSIPLAAGLEAEAEVDMGDHLEEATMVLPQTASDPWFLPQGVRQGRRTVRGSTTIGHRVLVGMEVLGAQATIGNATLTGRGIGGIKTGETRGNKEIGTTMMKGGIGPRAATDRGEDDLYRCPDLQSSAKMFRHSLMFEHLSFFLSTHPPYTTP